MSDRSPHVPVEELASGALGASAREHLEGCAECRQEAQEWAVTREAVGLMVAEVRPPARLIDNVLAGADQGSEGHPMGRRTISGLWQTGRERGRRLVASAAALAVAAGGVGYGIVELAGSSGGPAAQHAVTLVADCSGLESVIGTLQSVYGSIVVIRATNGSTVSVTADSTTHTVVQQPASMAAIRDGSPVIVTGTYSNGSLTAANVGELAAAPSSTNAEKMLNQGQALGTITDLTFDGFVVVGSGGVRVAVSTSPSTKVVATVSSAPGELKVGARTAAVGRSGPAGTLVASTVDQQASSLHLVGPPTSPIAGGSGSPAPGNERSGLSGLGCDPSTIATAALLVAE